MTAIPRKVIVTQGGVPDPNQEYERMIMYNEDGTDYSPPAGGVGPVEPVDVTGDLASAIHGQFGLVSADVAVQLTVKGQAHANASGDIGRVVMIVSGDNGATGTELADLATASPTDVPYTLSGLVPAGWKVFVGWTQNAAGANGTSTISEVITQPLA